MKTLVELAFEWREILIICYDPANQQWRASFKDARFENSKRTGFGYGNSPDTALKDYAKNIRGRRIQFASYGHEIRQIPEVLAS